MTGSEPRYWQVAAGSDSRDYAADFLKYGMAFVGGEKQIAAMAQVRAGDRVILKRGLTQIVAAGTVVERNGTCTGNATLPNQDDKYWLRDYDGWDLPAYCFVEWHVPAVPLVVKGLTRNTIQQVGLPELRQSADQIIATMAIHPATEQPQKVASLSDDEMLSFLIVQGLRVSTADELTVTLKRIRLLANYYYHADEFGWADVREHETRSFLIVPFLLALGWSEQQMKIELGVTGGRVDIACFPRPFRRRNDECVLLLESKGFSQGLDYAHGQGKAYASEMPECRAVIATNGYCYKAYVRKSNGDGFEESPTAYLNLLSPTKRYALNSAVGGGLEMLRLLLPNSLPSGAAR